MTVVPVVRVTQKATLRELRIILDAFAKDSFAHWVIEGDDLVIRRQHFDVEDF